MAYTLNKDKAKEIYSGLKATKSEFLHWENKNKIRILPPWSEAGMIDICDANHYFRLVSGMMQIKCFRLFGESCAVCDMLDLFREQFPKLNTDNLIAKESFVANAISRLDEDRGVVLIRYPNSLRSKFYNMINNPEIGDISDPIDGFDIDVTMTTKKGNIGQYREYNAMAQSHSSHLGTDEQVKYWLSTLNNLDIFMERPSKDVIERDLDFVLKYKKNILFRFGVIKKSVDVKEAITEDVSIHKVEDKKDKKDKKSDKPEIKKEVKKGNPYRKIIYPKCYMGHDNPSSHDNNTIGPNASYEKCQKCPHETECEDIYRKMNG